eukprot:UN27229
MAVWLVESRHHRGEDATPIPVISTTTEIVSVVTTNDNDVILIELNGGNKLDSDSDTQLSTDEIFIIGLLSASVVGLCCLYCIITCWRRKRQKLVPHFEDEIDINDRDVHHPKPINIVEEISIDALPKSEKLKHKRNSSRLAIVVNKLRPSPTRPIQVM